MKADQQKLPTNGSEREALREKGQFWTPEWVAEAMVGYVLAGGSQSIYDPAVGAGAFFRAAQRVAGELRAHLRHTLMSPEPSTVSSGRSRTRSG